MLSLVAIINRIQHWFPRPPKVVNTTNDGLKERKPVEQQKPGVLAGFLN